MKIDPYKHREKYFSWKEKVKDGIPNISKSSSELILRYIFDMEKGINISSSSVKGARSYPRLNNLRQRLIFFVKKIYEIYGIEDISKIKEDQLIEFFSDMKSGQIKRFDGKSYQSVDTYVKIFKAFWHWHQKVNRKQGKEILDITVDLDIRQEKPKWVYLTEEQVKMLCENAKYEYKVLIMFLLDTGIRAPTELMNIKVSDFYNDFKELQIRDEVSKTFGRRIKIMLCSDLLKEYIKSKKILGEDYLFPINPFVVNQYLKRLAKRILGDIESPAGQKYSELTMYDFRHVSCCYWLPRYKSESALKYRFGWKKSDKIHYYSEMLGMKDTISEDDLLVDVTKTEIEQKLAKSEKDKEVLQDEIKDLRLQVARIGQLTNQLYKQMVVETIV